MNEVSVKDNRIKYVDISKVKDIKKILSHKFLYENDSKCMQILLNIYNLEDSIENVFPTYTSMKHLKRDLLRFLKNKEGKELIAYNLSQLIHDDINRLELYLYLEGYRNGFHCVKCANYLEILALRHFAMEEIYGMKVLFQYETYKEDILNYKKSVFESIDADKKANLFLRETIFKYNKKILKVKIANLNNHLDRQLIIDYDSAGIDFKETNNILTTNELRGLSRKLIKFLFLDGIRIYKTAYWNGINDQVINRYQ